MTHSLFCVSSSCLDIDVVIPAWGSYLELVPAAIASVGQARRILVVTDDVDSVSAATLTRDGGPHQPDVLMVPRRGRSLGAARNSGLAHARSRWVLFLDADDAMLPGALSALVAAGGEHPDAVVCFGQFRRSDGTLWPGQRRARQTQSATGLIRLLSRNSLPMTGALLRRDACPSDLFPDSRSEDWSAAVRMRARGPVCSVGRPVLAYATWAGSRSRSAQPTQESVRTNADLRAAVLAERPGAVARRWWTLVWRMTGRQRRKDWAELAAYSDVAMVGTAA